MKKIPLLNHRRRGTAILLEGLEGGKSPRVHLVTNFKTLLSLSRVRLFATPNTPGFPALHYLPDLPQILSIESVMPSNHPVLCRRLYCPPSFPAYGSFSSEWALHIRWPKYCPGGSVVKNGPAGQETRIRSLCRRDPLEKEMATRSSILAWRIPWMEKLGGLYTPCGRRESDTT